MTAKRQYSEQFLREDLRRVADEIGRTPTRPEYNEHGESSSTTQRKRFGSWAAAVDEAGLEPRGHSTGGTPFVNSKYEDLVGDDAGGGEA